MSPPRSLVGLIGANIKSLLSPALHEDAFAVAGIRGHYHLMDLDRLPGRRLDHLLEAVKVAGFDGINVTFPCKEAVIAHCGAARVRRARSLEDAIAGAAGLVNATPVGMVGFPGNSVPLELLRADLWIADVIYTPIETPLISSARAKGARTLTGGGMCVHQAAETFRLF